MFWKCWKISHKLRVTHDFPFSFLLLNFPGNCIHNTAKQKRKHILIAFKINPKIKISEKKKIEKTIARIFQQSRNHTLQKSLEVTD